MRFFKSKSRPPAAQTYKEKVEALWAWWAAESDRILESVDGDGGGAIQPEITAAVGKLHPQLAWVFGPGADGQGHSFTLSAEGDRNFLFLTSYAISRAPELNGWTFYSSRQPSASVAGLEIKIGDHSIKTDSLWITPELDVEEEMIDITAWSPSFAEIGEEHSMRILFLLLDETLGEQGVESWLGVIEIGDGKLDDSLPLTELREFIEDTSTQRGWKKLPAEESYSSYHLEPFGK